MLMIIVMFIGFNFGLVLIGFVVGWLILLYGWCVVLLFGGVLLLLLILL